METNESILTKGVVSIDDRKQVRKVKGVIIDCDACGVSHYIVSSASTNSSLVLPFEKSLAVGDTFMTIQSRDDFLSTTDLTARGALEDNFDLVGLEVYSRAGSHLGVIKGFDIDTAFGNVTKIDLEDGDSFESESYVFFAREFVFVDDGTEIDADIRVAAVEPTAGETEGEAAPLAEPADDEVAVEPESEEVVERVLESDEADEAIYEAEEAEEEAAAEDEAECVAEGDFEDDPSDDVTEEPVAAELEADSAESVEEESDPDAELRSFLVGKKLNERVVSQDGSFVIEAGEEITEQVFAEAQKCDAVLLLTMSVDE